MASLSGGFNSNDVPDSQYDAIPEEWYRAVIVDSTVKKTKSGNGELIELKWQILDGQHKNRTLFDRVNWTNPNATAQMIGRQQLKKIQKAVGAPDEINDTAVLHMKPCLIKVVVTQYEGNDRNEIKNYKAALPATQQQSAASSSEKKAPAGWG